MFRICLILAGLTLAACTSLSTGRDEAALKAQFAPLTTEAAFLAEVAGREWRSDEIRVTFAPDGRLSGEVNGVPVTGGWSWRGSLFCSDFRVADSGGSGCSELGIRPGELLVVPMEGRGAPYTYTAA